MVLGDTFSCYVKVVRSRTHWMEVPLNLQIVGSYVQQGGKAHRRGSKQDYEDESEFFDIYHLSEWR